MNEYLIFDVGDSALGIAVSSVRQVVRAASLSAPTDACARIEGLLNLRGQVVPVIDLCAILEITQPPLAASDFLIVISDSQDHSFAVRTNNQVRMTSSEAMVDLPDGPFASAGRTVGWLREGSEIVALLDPDKLLSDSRPDMVPSSGSGT